MPTSPVQIRSRWNIDKILYEVMPPDDVASANQAALLNWAINNALKSGAVLSYADLRGADLRGAHLRGAHLSGADLSGAVLRGADLSYADLRDADLSGAVLSGAVLRGADLSYADLRGAVLSGAEIPLLEDIDAKILAAVEAKGNHLEMSQWHFCETTHCRAGWAIHLCGKAGYKLEAKVGSSVAGALIYAKSRPDKRVPNFGDSNENALADLRACAAESA